jgi:endogenous inhibitor of DNA gyrase (YacG/DUF329 family)
MPTRPLNVIGYMRIDVPCPHCGQNSLQLIRNLVANDSVPCTYCGERIDVSSKEWRAFISETHERFSQFSGYTRT